MSASSSLIPFVQIESTSFSEGEEENFLKNFLKGSDEGLKRLLRRSDIDFTKYGLKQDEWNDLHSACAVVSLLKEII
jgi:hypothetical protein